MRTQPYLGNIEPSTDDLLADPIAHLLMARDGLNPQHVYTFIEQAKRRSRARISARLPVPVRNDWLLSA
jgi:hypothetical protein